MNSTIYTNMDSVRNYNVFNSNASNASKAMERATTGLKIASAKDGTSQYAISAKMLERINSNTQASQNVQNDNAMMKTAEDGIANTVSILQTLKARAIAAADDTHTDHDRQIIQKEVDKLIDQIEDNSKNIKYNGKSLLDGTYAEKVTNATKSAGFLKLDSDVMGKTLSAYFGNLGTLAAAPSITVEWTDANGKAQRDSVGSFATSSTIASVFQQASNKITGATISSVDAGASITSDKSGGTISATDVGYAVVASNSGSAGRVGSVSITINSMKGNSKTFVFDEVQVGKDVNSATADSLTFQVGEEQSFKIDNVNIENMGKGGLGIGGVNVSTKSGAQGAIATIDTAIQRALAQQTSIGAIEQRLGFTADTLDTINENLQASTSTIRDSNMAKEISDYMKWNVLMQSSQYMLAQSNQNAFSVLNLLQ